MGSCLAGELRFSVSAATTAPPPRPWLWHHLAIGSSGRGLVHETTLWGKLGGPSRAPSHFHGLRVCMQQIPARRITTAAPLAGMVRKYCGVGRAFSPGWLINGVGGGVQRIGHRLILQTSSNGASEHSGHQWAEPRHAESTYCITAHTRISGGHGWYFRLSLTPGHLPAGSRPPPRRRRTTFC